MNQISEIYLFVDALMCFDIKTKNRGIDCLQFDTNDEKLLLIITVLMSFLDTIGIGI